MIFQAVCLAYGRGREAPPALLSGDFFAIPVSTRSHSLLRVQELKRGAQRSMAKTISTWANTSPANGLRATVARSPRPRSELRCDMNDAVSGIGHDRYGTFLDIGSWSTSSIRASASRIACEWWRPEATTCCTLGERLFSRTGFTCSIPNLCCTAWNERFRVIYERYSGMDGSPCPDPFGSRDVLAWIAGAKEGDGTVRCPQQGKWLTATSRKCRSRLLFPTAIFC